jgi:hypothetical protein
MNTPRTRREFLTDVSRGMFVATVGYEVAHGLGLTSAFAEETSAALSFGSLEPLVCLMQETPANKLLPMLVDKLNHGTQLRELLAAAAFANARTFGGEDYVGYHTMMALAPAFHMAQELPKASQPLPVFKVLYRNTNRLQERGGREHEVLKVVKPGAVSEGRIGGELLRETVRRNEAEEAEKIFAALAQRSSEDAFNDLLYAVQDSTEVHRASRGGAEK